MFFRVEIRWAMQIVLGALLWGLGICIGVWEDFGYFGHRNSVVNADCSGGFALGFCSEDFALEQIKRFDHF